jgi:hypothetical protein
MIIGLFVMSVKPTRMRAPFVLRVEVKQGHIREGCTPKRGLGVSWARPIFYSFGVSLRVESS